MLENLFTEKVKIEKLIPGGQALGTLKDSRKAFFWNALPGETVTEYRITKKKSHYLEAVATQIEDLSPHRVEPKDPCFLSTSPWQIMDFAFELEQKQILVKESLSQEHVDLNGAAIEPVKTDEREWFYRNKMEYALYYDHNTMKIHPAFHPRGSHGKLPIASSSIEKPEILQKAQEIIADLNARGEEARKYQSLLLRANQAGKVEGGLFENKKPHPVFNNLEDQILGKTYSYSPNGFFQINLPVYELALLEIAREIKTDKVLDLYAGVGTVGLSVARDKDLTLVEVNGAAYAELENNCKNTPAHPVLAKSEDALEYIEPDTTVILDPPRAGCDKKLIEKLLEVKPEKIIYLSCNPSTQARDVRLLTEAQKFTITKIKPFNFFPKTPHIENLITLTKK